MNPSRDSALDAFEHMVSFSSAPPPAGEGGDVHNARTTIAALPESFLDDLRRGVVEDPITAKYKTLEDKDVDDSPAERETLPAPPEPPAAPGPVAPAPSSHMRPTHARRPAAPPMPDPPHRMASLNAAVGAALAVANPLEEIRAEPRGATPTLPSSIRPLGSRMSLGRAIVVGLVFGVALLVIFGGALLVLWLRWR